MNINIHRLFFISSGFHHGTCRATYQVDHADEGLIITVSTRSGSGCLEQAVHAFQASVGVGGGPALNDSLHMLLQGSNRLSDRLKPWRLTDQHLGVVDEVGDTPLGGSWPAGLSNPGQLFFDPPGGGGIQPLLDHLGDGNGLVFGQVVGGASFEYRPAQTVGQGFFLSFSFAHFIDRAGEGLHDVEPVDRHRGVGQLLAHAAEKGWRHVTDHFDALLRVAAMAAQKVAELPQGLLALAGYGKEHRLLAAHHVDEDGDVVVSPFGGGLVQTDGLHAGEIEAGDGLSDVVLDDAPQPGIGDLHQASSGQYRHLSHQGHGGLLGEQGEGAAFTRPRHLNQTNLMFAALGARHTGRDVAVVLKEVQMAPALLDKVMGCAQLTALRTRVAGATLGLDLKVQLMRLLVRVQPLIHQLPRVLDTNAKKKDLIAVHHAHLYCGFRGQRLPEIQHGFHWL